MNEIIGPIYYTLAQDSNIENQGVVISRVFSTSIRLFSQFIIVFERFQMVKFIHTAKHNFTSNSLLSVCSILQTLTNLKHNYRYGNILIFFENFFSEKGNHK